MIVETDVDNGQEIAQEKQGGGKKICRQEKLDGALCEN